MHETQYISILREQLRQLLSEPPETGDDRAGRWLEEHGGFPGRPWILHGAGSLGQRVREHLLSTRQEIVAITDGNPTRWGSMAGGFRIQPPLEALAKWGNEAAVLVTICNTHHDFRETLNHLRSATVAPILPVQGYFWKFPQVFLPYYAFDLPSTFLEARDQLLHVAELLEDRISLDQFIGQLRWRLRLEPDALPLASPESQYFPSDLVPRTLRGLFVDCGAYDGDTIRALMDHVGPLLPPVVAYEPDPHNHARLLEWSRTLPGEIPSNMDFRAKAVGSAAGNVSFSGEGDAASRIDTAGTDVVPVVRLEEDLQGQDIGFLKMDLEGFEQEALLGASRLLGGAGQFAAVCIYHRPDDLWRIPEFMAKHFLHHRFHVRTHGQDGFDVVFYAIPTLSTKELI